MLDKLLPLDWPLDVLDVHLDELDALRLEELDFHLDELDVHLDALDAALPLDVLLDDHLDVPLPLDALSLDVLDVLTLDALDADADALGRLPLDADDAPLDWTAADVLALDAFCADADALGLDDLSMLDADDADGRL